MLALPVLEKLQKLARAGSGGIVEIGSYVGGSSIALASGHGGARAHAVIDSGGDQSDHPHLPSSDVLADWRKNIDRFNVGHVLRMFEGWSTDSRVFTAALDYVNRDIGLFFYDGDGRCDDQFAIFAKYMRQGCAIILDDYMTIDGSKEHMVKPWIDKMVAREVLIQDEIIDGTWFGNLGKVGAMTFTGYRHEQGFAYLAPSTSPADGLVRVFEDGRELGPAQALHDQVRKVGGGAYSHWMFETSPYVMFSASDNSDPNTNGRHYEFRRV
jgi:hypothetical protein